MRKWLLLLAVVIGLGVALLTWFAVEDARQEAALEARIREAEFRAVLAVSRAKEAAAVRKKEASLGKAPAEETRQYDEEVRQALAEAKSLEAEQARRQQSWPARLRREVRRRIGW